MDKENTFHTRVTYALTRADYLAAIFAFSAVVFVHRAEVRWGIAVAAFAWIDLVGYIPGALWYAYRTTPANRHIPRIFYLLYNTCHSFVVQGVVILCWRVVGGAWEWAMLAPAIHLCIDRGVFGNTYKPFGLAFEPIQHRAFGRFVADYERAPGYDWEPGGRSVRVAPATTLASGEKPL